ncbi:hypothetical protein AM588_10008608 [Phytophthora nicotianae]|uniref:Uncharacterized protein n=1 Tax=Phytophthora nicotianae TaxID=4792 RepID=A0A0W8DBM7_PHYNI|nr:hypothetical protein AM588_10008608 [Phytophthora nicotianae]
MAGGFASDTAAFLDADTRVVPHRALEHLSSLSAASLQALASAAAAELIGNSCSGNTYTEQQISVDNEALAAIARRQQLYTLGVEDEDLQMKLIPVLASVVPSVEHVLQNTMEELRSLVYRVQEAANEVEKLTTGNPSQLRTST